MRTLHSKMNDAEICRANEWTPGTRLVGDEGYGPTVIELTAVGERHILAKTISHNGKYADRVNGECIEGHWTLTCRDWRLA